MNGSDWGGHSTRRTSFSYSSKRGTRQERVMLRQRKLITLNNFVLICDLSHWGDKLTRSMGHDWSDCTFSSPLDQRLWFLNRQTLKLVQFSQWCGSVMLCGHFVQFNNQRQGALNGGLWWSSNLLRHLMLFLSLPTCIFQHLVGFSDWFCNDVFADNVPWWLCRMWRSTWMRRGARLP